MLTMDDVALLGRMEEGIQINSPWPPAGGGGEEDEEDFAIVRLPSHVHDVNKGLYDPRLVSIGPYHLNSATTRAMQAHKWRFLRDFLLRGGGAELLGRRLAACVREVRGVEARARRCYGETLGQVGSDDLVQLLVLDACFVLEFMLKHDAAELDAYMRWVWIYVYYDLLLVENQLPFFVLAKLFNVAMGNVDDAAAADDGAVDRRLLRLILKFFCLHEPLGKVPEPAQFTGVHHLLHLQYQRMVMVAPERPWKLCRISSRLTRELSASLSRVCSSIRARMIGTSATTPLAIPCATALMELGVTFKENTSPAGQFDVTFQDGTMLIPRLAISAGSRILMANMFALEQTKDWKEGAVTGYLVLMNALVSTGADVAALRRHGILDNMLSSDDDAAAFFNRLVGCALFDRRPHRFAPLFRQTNEHCSCRWNRYMAVLKRDHLRTPCSIINLLVAVMLLAVSVMSAAYTICRYRHGCS